MVETNTQLIDELRALNEQITKAKQEIQKYATENGKAIFLQLFQPLFDLGYKKCMWDQYTPYFNDGEPCEFSVYDLYVTKDEDADTDGYPEDGSWVIPYNFVYLLRDYQPPALTGWHTYTPAQLMQMEAQWNQSRQRLIDQGWTAESVQTFMTTYEAATSFMEANEDLLQMTFGDHVRVVVTSEGSAETFDRDHD